MTVTGHDRRRTLDLVKPDEKSGGQGEIYGAKTRNSGNGSGESDE